MGKLNFSLNFNIMVSANKQQEGYKSTLKSIRKAKAKLIFISNNCPAVWKTQLEYYAVLSGIKTILYDGNNVDLGSACGRFYRVSCLSIVDPGDFSQKFPNRNF